MRSALVVGAQGALGRAVVNAFSASGQWNVLGVDVNLPGDRRERHNVQLFQLKSPTLSIGDMQNELLSFVGSETKLSAIINVAGGWAGGSVKEAETALAAELMMRQSLFSSFAAAHVFAVRGTQGGLLAFTGAAAATQPTPSMLGYGTAKAGVHFLCRSIAADPAALPKDSKVLAVLPRTLDTPGNRSAMPDADFSTWTPVEEVAAQLLKWSVDAGTAPASGSLIDMATAAGVTTYKCV